MNLSESYNENEKIKILKNEYTIVNKDDSTIILKLDIPFCDELTTWKIYHNLIKYFKIQKNIIKKFEKFKIFSTELLQDKYQNLDIRKIISKSSHKSTNARNTHSNLNNKKYKKYFNKTINSERIEIKNKNDKKRTVNLFFQFFKKFPKNYLNSFLKMKKNEKMNNTKIISNNSNDEDEDFITPKKNKKYNRSLITYANINISNEKQLRKNRYSNSALSSYCISNYKSNTFRKGSNNSVVSISTFGDSKSLNKHNLILKNKTNNKSIQTNKKIKIEKFQKTYNKIYYRNDNRICSFFECQNINTNVECLPFILSQNQNINLSSIHNNNTSRINKNENRYYNVNKYNYPFYFNKKIEKISKIYPFP
jgi:hypothetical protein